MSERKPASAKPIAPYVGGKRNLAKRLCRVIDAHEHTTYAEPFVGMGGIFLRRSKPARSEFINDRSRDVYNLFRILQEHYVAFLDLLRFQITTQAGFERLTSVDPETLTDLQRAARFLFLQRVAFGGRVDGRTFGVSPDRPARFNLTTLEPDLEALHERLSGVTVMNLDYLYFIQRIDRPGALFYLDPPYHGCEDDYGKELFSEEDFDVIAAQLRALKGDFILSINDVPQIRALFDWAQIVPVQTTYSLASKTITQAPELVITSLDARWVTDHMEGR
ncbi:DNA adenine methylase [Roseobacter sp. YSTF-M11]|uniref:DNA adenine methylase n=1 Tax=Roseobacter insulae TaxID=2859783 RepID=A0A9X1FWG8_9RHOB|nr:DNA adenine methylase [Roseobacter insulae]MBW4708634.1 DNA adenine methylase [Roseobacter insulae]